MMKVKSRQALNRQLSFLQGSSILTSDQKQDLAFRLMNEKQDYHRWYVDWKLLEAYKTVFGVDSIHTRNMIESAKNKSVTKQFYCREATLNQLSGYEGDTEKDYSWNENVRVAVRVVRKQIKCHLEPKMLDAHSDVTEWWSNKSASAGAIGKGSKLENAQGCFEAALKIKELIRQGNLDGCWVPAIGFHRAQISNFVDDDFHMDLSSLKEKDRLVWGLDGATVTVEAQYAIPVIEQLSNNWFWYAGGKSIQVLRSILRSERIDSWTSVDYSKFDQTIPAWLIRLAFGLIKEMFDEQYWPELDWIMNNFIHTKIMFNGGICFEKHRGIPSGSNFTQVIGSMVNAIMLCTYLARKSVGNEKVKQEYVEVQVSEMLTMGDDNVVFTRNRIDLDDMSAYLERIFGVKINVEKTCQGSRLQPPEFIKREWRCDGEYQNPSYLLVNTTHPEHDRNYEDYSPWHILYGLYLTYSASFPERVAHKPTERFLVEQMSMSGGISALTEIPMDALPGVFRPYGRRALDMLVDRASRVMQNAWSFA